MARTSPPDAISEKDWRRDYGQQWDSKKSLTDNLIQREEDAHFNAQLWMAPCISLNLETLQAIGAIVKGHSCLASGAQGMAKSL